MNSPWQFKGAGNSQEQYLARLTENRLPDYEKMHRGNDGDEAFK
jgi:hypothetical protein